MAVEPVDVELLREMLREVERLLDRQMQAMEHLDRKAERLLLISVATFAGLVAVSSVLMQSGPPAQPGRILAALAPGALLNLLSLVLLIDGYLGFRFHPGARVGPSLTWIAEKSRDDAWALDQHLLTLLANGAVHEGKNAGTMHRTASRARAGLMALGAGVILDVVGYTFIIAGGA